MSKKVYKYQGSRQEMNGIEKSFEEASLNDAKIKRLEEKGWVEIKPVKKTKKKKKDAKPSE